MSRPVDLHARLRTLAAIAGLVAVCTGCRGTTLLHRPLLLTMTAAATPEETLRGPVEGAVAKLLARHVGRPVVQVSFAGTDLAPPAQRICIVSVSDETPDGAGDLAAGIRGIIQDRLAASTSFAPVDQTAVTTALRAGRLEPARLRGVDERRSFAALMEEQGLSVDFLLFATVSDAEGPDGLPQLELELIDARSGDRDEERADLAALSRRKE
jgi:hypothetical protein